MKIYGVYNVSNIDSRTFLNDISANINSLQNDGQEVEIQYKVTDLGSAILYSALIIGRK